MLPLRKDSRTPVTYIKTMESTAHKEMSKMLDIFNNSRTDRRDEIVLTIIAVLIPVATLFAMLGI